MSHLHFLFVYLFTLGKIGISLDNSWCEPISTDDVDACERMQEFSVSNTQNKM